MSPPLVSIVTPVLNRRDAVRACLKSVAMQSYEKVEHIVVDGGSTDGTTKVLEGFASSNPLVWISEPDSGMYSAINKGMRMAKGEILAYLNSDDLYLPYSIEAAVESMAGEHDIIYGDLAILYSGQSTALVPQFYRAFDMNYYTHFATIGQPAVFWTRSLMDQVGEFDESYRLLGDCEYWLRAAARGFTPVHVPEILAIDVEHEATLREMNPTLLREEFARLREQYLSRAGPPRARVKNEIGRRMSLRWNQLRLILAASGFRGAWPRFTRFLADRQIRIKRSGLLWFYLPQTLRPQSASLFSAGDLENVFNNSNDGVGHP